MPDGNGLDLGAPDVDAGAHGTLPYPEGRDRAEGVARDGETGFSSWTDSRVEHQGQVLIMAGLLWTRLPTA